MAAQFGPKFVLIYQYSYDDEEEEKEKMDY